VAVNSLDSHKLDEAYENAWNFVVGEDFGSCINYE